MAQATLDLPDPLAESPETAAGTDDLLAQMADAQIDQLMAESEREPAVNTVQTAPTQVSASLLPEVSTGGLAASSPPQNSPPQNSTPTRSSDKQLGDYLGKIADDATAELPIALPAPSLLSPHTRPHHDDAAAHTASDDHDAEAERHALRALDESHDDAPVASAVALLQPIVRKPSILVRILAFLNAPLASCSDETRDLLGKVAILTMVNAISVLVYVLFFRHPH